MKNFILSQIEQGKKIKGVRGWISIRPTIECGRNSSGVCYVPVIINKMKSETCGSITLLVSLDATHHLVNQEDQFEISPSGFYQSTEEITKVIEHRKKVTAYNQLLSSITNRGYNAPLASKRRDALIDLYNRSTDEAKAVVDKELAERGTTLKKCGQEYFDVFAKTLAKPLYFPDNEDVDTDEDWED